MKMSRILRKEEIHSFLFLSHIAKTDQINEHKTGGTFIKL
jgi:hypothetical protein